MALWISEGFGVRTKSFRELNFEFKTGTEVFILAKQYSNTIIITTKDIDFIYLAEEIGAARGFFL